VRNLDGVHRKKSMSDKKIKEQKTDLFFREVGLFLSRNFLLSIFLSKNKAASRHKPEVKVKI